MTSRFCKLFRIRCPGQRYVGKLSNMFFYPLIRTLMNDDFQTRTWLILLLRSLIVLVAWSLSSLQSLVSSSNLSVTSSHWCFSSPGKIEQKRTRLVWLYLRFKLAVKILFQSTAHNAYSGNYLSCLTYECVLSAEHHLLVPDVLPQSLLPPLPLLPLPASLPLPLLPLLRSPLLSFLLISLRYPCLIVKHRVETEWYLATWLPLSTKMFSIHFWQFISHETLHC